MKTTTLVGMLAVLLLVGGGIYYFQNKGAMSEEGMSDVDRAMGPTGAAGINGSDNQGNMGQVDTDSTGSAQAGVVQQPMADGAEGSVIGQNVALGTDSKTDLGTYLIAYNGMTVYTFSKDTSAASTCYDQCAINWPPYIVGAEDNLTQLKAGVSGKVDTTTRKDGSLQVTYNGHPLYFWKNDTKSGDTTGQNVGGVWFVVKP